MASRTNTLPKIFTREFPLLLCQVWGRAYLNFLGRTVKTFPRNIFLIRNGLVENYRNPLLFQELNGYFADALKRDHRYLSKFSRRALAQFHQLERFWREPLPPPFHKGGLGGFVSIRQKRNGAGPALRSPADAGRRRRDLNPLLQFCKELENFWPAIYAAMYLPRGEKLFSIADRTLMAKLRTRIDTAADRAADLITSTLRRRYPRLGELVNLITFNDLAQKEISQTVLHRRARQIQIMVDDEFITARQFTVLKQKYHFDLEKTAAPENVKELRGQTANPGHARGQVRLLLRRGDIPKFKPGEILVSTMTTPDFVPAMRQAAAIVTDEGGITCHAAIISRELNIPCIIGTKIATKVLKDGDQVEVDATKGIIRKLFR